MVKQLGLAAILMTMGCQAPEIEVEEETEPLYFETIGLGQAGVNRDTVETVASTAEEWQLVSSEFRPLAPFSEVDFSQAMVALIAIPTESGGYTIEVESVERTGEGVRISYLVSEPGVDCITPTALALPFQAVLFRSADGDVRFERRTERYKCGM